MRQLTLSLLAIFSAIPTLANADLIVNGSFENPVVPNGVDFIGNVSSVSGWTVQTVDLLAFNARSGNQAIDLVGSPGLGFVEQTIITTPGQNYQLDFHLRSPTGGAINSAVRALWNGNSLGEFDVLVPTYSIFTFQVQAVGTSSTVRFEGLNSLANQTGPVLDDVSLSAVPEPSTLILALPLGVGLVLRRCRTIIE